MRFTRLPSHHPARPFHLEAGHASRQHCPPPVDCPDLGWYRSVAATTCWDYFDQIYLAVFNREQWDNLTYRLQDNDVSIHDTCLVPAVSWTPLSLLTWQVREGKRR